MFFIAAMIVIHGSKCKGCSPCRTYVSAGDTKPTHRKRQGTTGATPEEVVLSVGDKIPASALQVREWLT